MMRVAIATGMILVLIGSAIGQDYQPTRSWTMVDNAAISSFFGKLLIEAAKKYLGAGVKHSKYFVSSVIGSIFGAWAKNKYCYYLESNSKKGFDPVLIPAATSWHRCQKLAKRCAPINTIPRGVQYSKRIDFPDIKICHKE